MPWNTDRLPVLAAYRAGPGGNQRRRPGTVRRLDRPQPRRRTPDGYDLIGLSDVEGAQALEISREAFRQRLARARVIMRGIIADRCGLVRAEHPRRCDRQVDSSIAYGILDPRRPVFSSLPGATTPIPADTLAAAARELDLATAIAEAYRSGPHHRAPDDVWQALQQACPALTG